MNKKRQQGFGWLPLLLLIFLILLLLLIGWFVKKRQDNSKPANSSASSQQSSSGQPANQQSTASQAPQNAVKYLEIKEYGVKIVLTKDIEDAYYVIERDYPYLSIKSLQKYADCDLSKNKGSGSVAAVARTKVGDDNFGSPWTQSDLEKVSKLKNGDYYYWIDLANGAACSDPTGQSPDPAEIAARKAFSAAKIEKL